MTPDAATWEAAMIRMIERAGGCPIGQGICECPSSDDCLLAQSLGMVHAYAQAVAALEERMRGMVTVETASTLEKIAVHAAVAQAVQAEREACAQMVLGTTWPLEPEERIGIAASLRARGPQG